MFLIQTERRNIQETEHNKKKKKKKRGDMVRQRSRNPVTTLSLDWKRDRSVIKQKINQMERTDTYQSE